MGGPATAATSLAEIELAALVEICCEMMQWTMSVNGELGFLWGLGVVPAFLKEYYDTGSPSPWTAARTLANGIASTLVRGEVYHRLNEGCVCEVSYPGETWQKRRWLTVTATTECAALKPVPETLYERMTVGGESFWTVVYEPFMSRDLTWEDLRAIVSRGLVETKGSYKLLLEVFNLAPSDYKRLLGILRKYQCHMPFHQFRTLAVRSVQIGYSRVRPSDHLAHTG